MARAHVRSCTAVSPTALRRNLRAPSVLSITVKSPGLTTGEVDARRRLSSIRNAIKARPKAITRAADRAMLVVLDGSG